MSVSGVSEFSDSFTAASLLLFFEEENLATELTETRDVLDQTFIKNEHFCIILNDDFNLKTSWLINMKYSKYF